MLLEQFKGSTHKSGRIFQLCQGLDHHLALMQKEQGGNQGVKGTCIAYLDTSKSNGHTKSPVGASIKRVTVIRKEQVHSYYLESIVQLLPLSLP
jgi:hypothetical protein